MDLRGMESLMVPNVSHPKGGEVYSIFVPCPYIIMEERPLARLEKVRHWYGGILQFHQTLFIHGRMVLFI